MLLNNDIDRIRNISFEELSSIDGVGDVIATKWIEAFNNEDFINSFEKLLKEVTFVDSDNNNTTLDNLTFVITGSLNEFNNRDEMIEFIEKNGGKVVSAISSNVNYLINNDVNSTSTKNKKAHELGIKIISENELLDMTNR